MDIYHTPYGLNEPQWVESIYAPPYCTPRIRWTLRDKRRDYARLTCYQGEDRWHADLMPGNGKIEVAGSFTDLERAKHVMEAMRGIADE